MKQHTRSLTLAALLATLPALAADWAHNDPDKASTGKVQIWDGSKTVTVNSAPTTAVATMGGGTALGGVVQSPLSFNQFIAANDLDAANWRDITWRGGADTLSISGTDLSKSIGKDNIDKIKMPGSPRVDRYFTTGKFYYPAGSKHKLISSDGYSVKTYTKEYGRESNIRTISDCSYVKPRVSVIKDEIHVTLNYVSHIKGKYGTVCGVDKAPSINLTVTSPPAPAQPITNHFIRVNK